MLLTPHGGTLAPSALTDIELVALIAQRANMAAAARELGVTPPAVSRRLAALEQRLGVRLFQRSTRKISLTDAGERYVSEGSSIIEAVRGLEAQLSGAGDVQGTVKIAASLGFGRTHLAPALARFARATPTVHVQLSLSDRPLSLIDPAQDLLVRFGEPDQGSVVARLLAHNQRVLCAAPAYLRARGVPTAPRDLARHDCIFIRQADETFGTWRFRHARHGARSEAVKVRSRLSTNDGSSALAWALDGHGILLRSQWEIADALRRKRLVPVLPDWRTADADIYLVFAASVAQSTLPLKLRVLIDALLTHFAPYRRRAEGAWGVW